MSDPVIIAEGVSKKFCRSLKRSMLYGLFDAGRSMVGLPYETDRLRASEFWALDRVSFEIRRGEKVGFLGVNGSGKSTLLRLITGIFPPDDGRLTVRGQVGALIAVGVGFHPHLTGRENVFLNGSILGMSRQQLEARIDDIVDFAEIGEFIDAPVATYSSGMAVRLGFSIAIHRDPTIMLVDEVLAVGDLAFQLKCQKKLAEYRSSGGTFIIVSHNMQMIRNTCDRVLWLDKGRVVADGEVYEICERYEDAQLERSRAQIGGRGEESILNYDPSVRVEGVRFVNGAGDTIEALEAGEPLKVELGYRAERRVERPLMTIALTDARGVVVFETYSNRDGAGAPVLEGRGRILVEFAEVALRPDLYFLSVTLSEGDLLNKLEWHERSHVLRITGRGIPNNQGIIYPYPKWRFTPEAGP